MGLIIARQETISLHIALLKEELISIDCECDAYSEKWINFPCTVKYSNLLKWMIQRSNIAIFIFNGKLCENIGYSQCRQVASIILLNHAESDAHLRSNYISSSLSPSIFLIRYATQRKHTNRFNYENYYELMTRVWSLFLSESLVIGCWRALFAQCSSHLIIFKYIFGVFLIRARQPASLPWLFALAEPRSGDSVVAETPAVWNFNIILIAVCFEDEKKLTVLIAFPTLSISH